MGMDSCGSCGHVYTKEGNDIPHSDGGVMDVIHGGGVCRPCYIEDGHKECACGTLAYENSKFCAECGKGF